MGHSFTLGCLAEPLTEQLKGLAAKSELESLERDSNAINRLTVRGYITERQCDSARKKLVKNIQAAAQKFAKAVNAA